MKQTLLELFGQELATVVAALAGSSATAAPGDTPVSGEGWTITVDTDVAARGSWTILVGAEGADALTAAIMGLTGDVPPTAVADTLGEAINQTVSSLSLLDAAGGVKLRSGDVAPHTAVESRDGATTFVVTCPGVSLPLTLTIVGEIDVTAAAPAGSSAGAAADEPKAPDGGFHSAPPPSERLDAILDIELPLIVRFGRTELPLRTLAHLGPGSLIDLGRSADDPVDLLVSNRVVARGEVVVVGGNYGVRVLDVVSPRERARSMEA